MKGITVDLSPLITGPTRMRRVPRTFRGFREGMLQGQMLKPDSGKRAGAKGSGF